jgi:tRNA (cytidine/uridine-2'-O-)-methyltransferase
MDYWKLVQWHRWPNWSEFSQSLPTGARLWFIESGGPRHYAEVGYQADDYLVFGRETAGLPASLYQSSPDRWLRIPMANTDARSLNLSNCAAIVLFEALRQTGFKE